MNHCFSNINNSLRLILLTDLGPVDMEFCVSDLAGLQLVSKILIIPVITKLYKFMNKL